VTRAAIPSVTTPSGTQDVRSSGPEECRSPILCSPVLVTAPGGRAPRCLRYGHDGDGRHSGASFCTISTSHYAEYALVESDPRGRSPERHGASALGITRPVAGGTIRGWNHMGICGHYLAGAANLYRNTATSRAEAPDGALPRAELDSCQQCQRSHRRDGYPTLPQSGGSVRLWDGIHGCYCSRSGH
jgi:hypothetical protein